MNRRAFIGALAAATAGFALDPERLLWRPGAKTIFLPAATPLWVPAVGDLVALGGIDNATFSFWRNQQDDRVYINAGLRNMRPATEPRQLLGVYAGDGWVQVGGRVEALLRA